MADYEAAAYTSLEKLKEKHDYELKALRDSIENTFNVKYTFSKDLMEIKSQEKKFFALKEYSKADKLKTMGERLEQEEREMLDL
jgi:hypothetical protein